MLVFYTQEEFYNWLPTDRDALLERAGVTQEEFYGRYLSDNVCELDRDDVAELMELVSEVAYETALDNQYYCRG